MSNKQRWQKLAGLLTEGHEDRWPSREDEEEELSSLRAKDEPESFRATVVDDVERIGGRKVPDWMRSDYDPKNDPYSFDLDYDPYKALDEQVDEEDDKETVNLSKEMLKSWLRDARQVHEAVEEAYREVEDSRDKYEPWYSNPLDNAKERVEELVEELSKILEPETW